MQEMTGQTAHDADDAAENHDGGHGPAVEGRAFHESADGLEIFGRPIRIHGRTLHCKVSFSKEILDCGDRSPLWNWQTCLPTGKRGHVRALHTNRFALPTHGGDWQAWP